MLMLTALNLLSEANHIKTCGYVYLVSL